MHEHGQPDPKDLVAAFPGAPVYNMTHWQVRSWSLDCTD